MALVCRGLLQILGLSMFQPLLRAWMAFFSCAMERLYALASDLPPDLLVLLTACNYLISALRDSMVECFLAFVFVRNLVLVTNTPGISWLLVAASVMFYRYVSTCDSMSVQAEGR